MIKRRTRIENKLYLICTGFLLATALMTAITLIIDPYNEFGFFAGEWNEKKLLKPDSSIYTYSKMLAEKPHHLVFSNNGRGALDKVAGHDEVLYFPESFTNPERALAFLKNLSSIQKKQILTINLSIDLNTPRARIDGEKQKIIPASHASVATLMKGPSLFELLWQVQSYSYRHDSLRLLKDQNFAKIQNFYYDPWGRYNHIDETPTLKIPRSNQFQFEPLEDKSPAELAALRKIAIFAKTQQIKTIFYTRTYIQDARDHYAEDRLHEYFSQILAQVPELYFLLVVSGVSDRIENRRYPAFENRNSLKKDSLATILQNLHSGRLEAYRVTAKNFDHQLLRNLLGKKQRILIGQTEDPWNREFMENLQGIPPHKTHYTPQYQSRNEGLKKFLESDEQLFLNFGRLTAKERKIIANHPKKVVERAIFSRSLVAIVSQKNQFIKAIPLKKLRKIFINQSSPIKTWRSISREFPQIEIQAHTLKSDLSLISKSLLQAGQSLSNRRWQTTDRRDLIAEIAKRKRNIGILSLDRDLFHEGGIRILGLVDNHGLTHWPRAEETSMGKYPLLEKVILLTKEAKNSFENSASLIEHSRSRQRG